MSISLRRSLAVSLLALAACSSGPSTSTGTTGGKDGGPDGSSTGGGGGSGGSPSDAGNPTDVVGLAISPPTATLASVDGSTPTQAFALLAVQRDGTQVPIGSGEWSPSQSFLGALAMDASGNATFTANGIAGGSADVTAKALGFGGKLLQATATVTVTVQRTVAVPGAPADAPAQFAAATPDPAATAAHLLYPLDGARMPNNVAPLDVQWENGAAGDLYRVTLTRPHAVVTAYVLHSGAGFTFDWTVDALAWRSIAESDPGASTSVEVDLLASATGKVAAGAPVTVQLAQGSLYGAVYYWAINEGRLQTINADTAARTPVMASPPSGCIACHTISRDGRFLAGALDGSPRRLAVFDLTNPAALQASPAEPLFTPALTEVFATFSPDDTRLLVSGFGSAQGGGDGSDGFTLIDSSTGAVVPSTGLPTDPHVAHPDWSPDGNNVVYVGNISGQTNGYPSHFTASDLEVMSVSGTSPVAFGAPALLHQGAAPSAAAEGGTADAHPTWSPDSKLVAFQHGQVAYSQFNPNAALYAVSGTPGGAAVRLDNASGGPAGTSAFWPTFSPFTTTEGGVTYYWLAYFSQRDYGNAQVGTRGTSRRQLWVTAVRADGTGDPSSVPYWLPGQDTASENAAARWAPIACRANAADCQVSSECCSGSCLPDPSDPAQFVCTPPPPDQCHHAGQLCGGTGDCCPGEGLVCIGNVCGSPPPN